RANAASAAADAYPAGQTTQMRNESPRKGFTGATSDAWITTKGKTRLIRRPGIAPLAINVDTRNGILTLFGDISTGDVKREAGRQAMKVAGVKGVHNDLQVVSKYAEKQVAKQDGKIRKDVEKRIGQRDVLHKDDIDVEVSNGVVRLTGSVDRAADRMTAD